MLGIAGESWIEGLSCRIFIQDDGVDVEFQIQARMQARGPKL